MTAPTPTPGVAVQTVALSKHYGQLTAVDHLDMAIPRGSIFGLIGPNGAGKTTTFAMLASVVRPTAGWAEVAGANPAADPREVRRQVGFMPDSLGVYDGLRVAEYLEFFAAAYRIPRAQWRALVNGLLELVDLTDKRETLVDSMSRGMKQRLSLARALVHDPSVLILDEPASGLDPRARVELRNLLLELRDMGKTVVISSHILAELEEMCTDIAIMDDGRLVAAGSLGALRDGLQVGRHVNVRLAGGEERSYTVADEVAQADLLRRLVVDENLPVVEFAEADGGLEDVFLRVTDREPQGGDR